MIAQAQPDSRCGRAMEQWMLDCTTVPERYDHRGGLKLVSDKTRRLNKRRRRRRLKRSCVAHARLGRRREALGPAGSGGIPRMPQIGLLKAGLVKASRREVRGLQVGVTEVSSFELSTAQIDTLEVGKLEVGAAEVGSPKAASAQVCAA